MKILITGATGLIGKELVLYLLQNGVHIHYLTTSLKKIENQPSYEGFYWNPSQGIIDENCFIGVDVIIHLAGATVAKRWTNAYKEEILESRVLSANLLYKALKDNPHQVKQYISASGVAIYPNSDTKVFSENTPDIDDGFLSNVVLKWEESADLFKLLNIKVCKFRTGIVFSKNGGALQKMVNPIKFGVGAAFGNGKQIQSWIHIHDLVALYYFAILNSWEGNFNAVAPKAISNELLTKTIANILHKPILLPNIPEFIMKMLLGEMHLLLFENKNVSAQKVIDCGFKFDFPIPEKALLNILT